MMLLVFSAIPLTVVSEPVDIDPPVKKMDTTDDNITNISATMSPPILDGVIKSSENWNTNDHIGNACVAKDPNPVAKVYMTVEIDSNGTYQNLWIGIDMNSSLYLDPGNGQWLRIDWDQDGVLDYEDHTGWNESDGKDSSSGSEWMIPWGTVRVNPSKTPYQMNFSLIENEFDILIHLEVFGYNETEEEDEEEDEEEEEEDEEEEGNETEEDDKKDKENKTKGYEKDKKNKKRSIEEDDPCESNNTKNETSETATFPPRPNAGPFMSTTISAWTIPDGCQYESDDDDDVYDPDDDRDQPDWVDDDSNDTEDDDDDDNDTEEDDDEKTNHGKTKGPNDNSNVSEKNKNKTQPDNPSKKPINELSFGIFDGDYLYFEYNLSAELLKNIKMYNISVFDTMHIENASFNKEKVSKNLFKGDGAGAKLLGHDNPVALVQVLGRDDLTIMLNITDGWSAAQDNATVTLTDNNMSVLLRLLGRPSSSLIKVTNDQIILLMGKGSQLQLRVANVSALQNKTENPGCVWFEETQDSIFDNIGYEILGAEATISGSDEDPSTQITNYLDGFNVEIKKIEGNSISLVLTSESGSGNMVAISMLKETLQLPENTQILVTLNNEVLLEAKELTELSPDETGYYRISDSDGEQVLITVSEVSTQEITIQFIPELEPDDTPLAEPWTAFDFIIIFAILIVIIIAGMYIYVSRRED
jgi:hypothetical protein